VNDMSRPQLPSPRGVILEAIKESEFDADVYHVINERDNQLISDEVLHGALSNKFVYEFEIQGKQVAGVSVVGARHLAYFYGGLRHRIIATVEKKGALHIFTSYPNDATPMSVHASFMHEIADEPDYYKAVVELADVKKGNTVQVEVMEMRFERKRDGSMYERPNFQKIAQSKGYRNGVLDLVPQDVVMRFKMECLKLGKADNITDSVIEQKRANVLRFAAAKGIPLDRESVRQLTFEQIAGLGDAAREGEPRFRAALDAIRAGADPETGEVTEQRQIEPPRAQSRRRKQPGSAASTTDNPSPSSPEAGGPEPEGSNAPAAQLSGSAPPQGGPFGG
jgi:hypothetical protein